MENLQIFWKQGLLVPKSNFYYSLLVQPGFMKAYNVVQMRAVEKPSSALVYFASYMNPEL